MPNPTEFCSTTDLKIMLGITSSGSDSLLALIKASVEKFVLSYCARDFFIPSVNYVEYYDGDGGPILRLNQRPIVSIATIYADPALAFEAGSLIPATDIIADTVGQANGYVELFMYRFLKGRKGIKVTYSAGYATIPDDLAGAVRKIVCQQFKVADKKLYAEISQQVGDKQITLNPDAYPKDAMFVLDRYRRIEL